MHRDVYTRCIPGDRAGVIDVITDHQRGLFFRITPGWRNRAIRNGRLPRRWRRQRSRTHNKRGEQHAAGRRSIARRALRIIGLARHAHGIAILRMNGGVARVCREAPIFGDFDLIGHIGGRAALTQERGLQPVAPFRIINTQACVGCRVGREAANVDRAIRVDGVDKTASGVEGLLRDMHQAGDVCRTPADVDNVATQCCFEGGQGRLGVFER